MADFWTITTLGRTQSLAAWGVSGLQRERTSAKTSIVKFVFKGMKVGSPLPFAWKQPLMIARNGAPWFSGIVTKPDPKSRGNSESIAYEISDPWYWLEQTPFQQQWVEIDPSGDGVETMTTTQSCVLLSQALDGVKMHSGQVMREVLIYAQYAYQGIPFPSRVDVNHLPPLPDQSKGPFQIGRLTPDIIVPYEEQRDRSCAYISRLMMKYTRDAVAWLDHSTVPPTLNIDRRGNLPKKTIKVLDGYGPGEFNPRPRYDLQVSGVIVKFQQTNDIDGRSLTSTTVQKFPPSVRDNDPDLFVQTIDLVGGSVSYLKQTVSVTSRPTKTSSQEQALAWLLNHNSTLGESFDFSQATLETRLPGGAFALTLSSIETVVDPNSEALAAPYHMPPDGTGYNNELVGGAVTPWMWDDANLLAADATIKFTFNYSGADEATIAYFQSQPTPGTLIIPARTKITNAGGISGFTSGTVTKDYQTTASATEGEPVPPGYAQSYFESSQQLHFDGDHELTERECSDQLPLGCTFNTSDGNPDWHTMDALVLRVTEDIDGGKTKVTFGPPAKLGLDTKEELFRVNLGRLPSQRLGQRTTGVASDGANVVQGHTHSSASSSHCPPGGAPVRPWSGVFSKTAGGQLQITIYAKSYLQRSEAPGDNAIVTGLGAPFNVNAAGDTVYLQCPVTTLEPGNSLVTSQSVTGTFTNQTSTTWATGAFVQNDGGTPPNQTFFRIKLGTVTTGPKGPVYTPSCTSNLVIANTAINGDAAIYPHPAASTSTP